MIIETKDFSYKSLGRGRFFFVPYEKKQLREGARVSTVWEFDLFGFHLTATKVSKP